MHEILALLFHDVRLFLAHRAPHKVAASQCIAAEIAHDLHYLLLIDDTAVSGRQDRLELRAGVPDRGMVIFSPDICRDKIHRPRTIQGNPRYDILQCLRLEFLHKVFHALTFKLEHAVRPSCSEGSEHFLVIVVKVIYVDMDACRLFHIVHRVLDDRQGAQSQKVHFQQPQLLDRGHGKLCRDRAVTPARQWHKLVRRLLADHNARSVHRRVTRKSFQLQAHVDQIVNLLVLLIQLSELRIHFEGARDRDRRIALVWYHLGYPVHIIIWKVERTPHIANHALCRHRTERHDLNNLVMPVFLTHIVDHFLPPLIAEINVNIGHRHALRVQEPLKQQAVADWIDVRDMQAVRDDASRRRAAPRTDGNVMLPGPVDKIPHDQEVIYIPHFLNHAKLVVQLFPDRAVIVGIALRQPVGTELVEVTPRVIALRNVELRQFRHAKLDLHIATVGNHRRVVERLLRVWKQLPHLHLALDIVLPAIIAHPVLVGDLLRGLDTEQDIM